MRRQRVERVCCLLEDRLSLYASDLLAAYQSILSARRRELHAAIARVVEAHFPEVGRQHPEILAHHFSEAGIADRSIEQWIEAGSQAAARYAHIEAIAHLDKGLTQLAQISGQSCRNLLEIELQRALGVSLLALKGFAAPEVGTVYSRIERLSLAEGVQGTLYPAKSGRARPGGRPRDQASGARAAESVAGPRGAARRCGRRRPVIPGTGQATGNPGPRPGIGFRPGKVSWAFVVMLPARSVGATGNGRRYHRVVRLRAVETIDFMTVRRADLPYRFLDFVSRRSMNEIEDI